MVKLPQYRLSHLGGDSPSLCTLICIRAMCNIYSCLEGNIRAENIEIEIIAIRKNRYRLFTLGSI